MKEHEDSWMVLYWWLNRKDMVKNHSGHDGFKHWEREEGGQKIIIEKPPVGIYSLPISPRYNEKVDSAFVTSFGLAGLCQKISLRTFGLTPRRMELMIPFRFICTGFGARFDCGGEFFVALELVNAYENCMTQTQVNGVIQSASNWTAVSCSLLINLTFEELSRAKYLLVSIRGKDYQYWRGHYGTKFSRISVDINLMQEGQTYDFACIKKINYR